MKGSVTSLQDSRISARAFSIGRTRFPALLLVFAGACGSQPADSAEELLISARTFVPENAFDVNEETNLPWTQVSFNVRSAPLEFGIDLDRLKTAQSERWSICTPPNNEWTGYEDLRESPSIYTQHRKYLLHRNGVTLVVIGMVHYESEQQANLAQDSTHQVVQEVVVVGTYSSTAEAEREAIDQGLVCRVDGFGIADLP